MIAPIRTLSPQDIESHPELPVLVTLEIALDMTLLALCTWLPELSDPDYNHSPSPDLRAAAQLLARIESLRRAARDYRHVLALYDDPEHPFAADQEPPYAEDISF